MDVVTPVLLGIVEGLTEFLPVSSTGHLILATKLLGYDAGRWEVFNIVIQLGAILAVVVLYWRTFWAVLQGLVRRDAASWRFVRNILVAFIPAGIIGLALHKKIEALLGNAILVAVALIVGGIAILIVERLAKRQNVAGVAEIPLPTVIGIGFIQCLAMIPGVSRSGATIMGALGLGVERRTAAEFSFFLAIPTMFGATAVELFKHRHELAAPGSVGLGTIAIGFVVAFIVAIVVIRAFVSIVTRHGFAPFAWYRIVAGVAALIWLVGWAPPSRADPLPDQHLPGERIGGEVHDARVNRRVDTRLPTRLETRIDRRGTLNPLAKANSVITAAPTSGCKEAGTGAAPICPPQ